MRTCVGFCVLAFFVGGCGTSTSSGEEVARSWVSAVDSEDRRAACALMVASKTPCEQQLELFADKDVRLLEPGGYLNGSEATDNKTRFAVATEQDDIGYFEIVDRGGQARVDLQVVTEGYDEP